ICEKLVAKSLFKIMSKPLSDGGDGFLNVCKSIFKTEPLQLSIKNDLDSIENEYTVQFDSVSKNVFIESAELFGLKLLSKSQRDPLDQNSELLGKIIARLADDVNFKNLDVQTIWIGVGGTATIDFGIGACSQLGLGFYDGNCKSIIPIPKNFNQIKKIEFNKPKLPFKIKCVVDVKTELIGEPGAIEIYGTQKGASENDLRFIKKGIENILTIVSNNEILNIPEKINGAGGGLAAGLNIFFNSEIIPAEKFITEYLLHNINLDEIDAVITGEGSFDYQSFEGKGLGVILNLFKDKSIPIFLVNGSTNLPDHKKLPKNITIINTIDFFNSSEESIKYFQTGIEKATEIVVNQLNY
ncbi:MAG: glycerate kinase, partial [Ignavibacteria bacterium]|nr:glycerate kinase [Ignavibacteria bacterium]